MAPACKHVNIQVEVAEQAAFEPSFKRPAHGERVAASKPDNRVDLRQQKGQQLQSIDLAVTFPAPLVLPDDLLDFPENSEDDPPQTMHSWMRIGRPITARSRKKTIYVAPVPQISDDPSVSYMREWISPQHPQATKKDKDAQPPKAEDVCDYLRAFYHPLEVKLLPQTVAFVPWEGQGKKTSRDDPHRYIGLQVGTGLTRIRTRPCPDKTFSRQVQLNDILDAAIAALPADAYSLVMLVDHDTYEDEDDDFCCGRAYGGSRVCMVSSARYHPGLDAMAKVDRAHMWPASHCKAYVEKKCGWEANKTTKKRKLEVISKDAPTAGPETAMRGAVDALLAAPKLESELDGLWFSRVARTVSHELGHCFSMAHCSYYACMMQGTANVAEDVRQPPYLCPVCLAKVTHAIRGVCQGGVDEKQYQIERYKVLLEFCRADGKWGKVGMFAGFRGWLETRIEEHSRREKA
ncbi:hypothetical protein QBC43DRAFT_323924 [Cladorrhinum sp. PSN259]|nr:hypothetical protein QBC43DRAFT_323924 [Cladorrhinum sp. PSN259]